MRKKLYKILAVFVVVAMIMTLSACASNMSEKETSRNWTSGGNVDFDDNDNNDNNYTSDSTDNNAVISIVSFSQKYGISPTRKDGYFETYNQTVSVDNVQEYALYLQSCGYSRDTETEEQYKNDFELVYAFEGDIDTRDISMSYSGGVFIIAYGSDCIFDEAGGSGTQAELTTIGGQTLQLCPICSGLGKVMCSSCDGSGYFSFVEHSPDYGSGDNIYENKKKCPRCNGSGYAKCTHCSGTGYIG